MRFNMQPSMERTASVQCVKMLDSIEALLQGHSYCLIKEPLHQQAPCGMRPSSYLKENARNHTHEHAPDPVVQSSCIAHPCDVRGHEAGDGSRVVWRGACHHDSGGSGGAQHCCDEEGETGECKLPSIAALTRECTKSHLISNV